MDAQSFADATPVGWYLLPSTEAERRPTCSVNALPRIPFGPWLERVSADGTVDVIERLCPHMGADLCVVGEFHSGVLRCMFHGRPIAADGRCGAISEGLRVRRAELRSAQAGQSPDPRTAMFAAPRDVDPWEPLDFSQPIDARPYVEVHSESEVPVAPQIMLEGECDSDHFLPVHGVAATDMSFESTGTSGVLSYRFPAIETTAKITFDGLTRFRHELRSPTRTVDYVCWIARIGPARSHIEGTLRVHAESRAAARREFVSLARGFQQGVDQDRRIWLSRRTNVIHLTERDGNVRAFRDWASGLLRLDETANA